MHGKRTHVSSHHPSESVFSIWLFWEPLNNHIRKWDFLITCYDLVLKATPETANEYKLHETYNLKCTKHFYTKGTWEVKMWIFPKLTSLQVNNRLKGLTIRSFVLHVVTGVCAKLPGTETRFLLASLRLQPKSPLKPTTIGRTLCIEVLFGELKKYICKSKCWMNDTLP